MHSEMTHGYDIRAGSRDDIARIAEIDRTEKIAVEYQCRRSHDGRSIEMIEKLHDPPMHRPNWSEEGIERRRSWWVREVDAGGCVFVAESRGRLAGIAVSGPEKPGQCAELVSLFVGTAHRARGLGKELLNQLEGKAKDQGIEAIYVGSNENENALGFYRRMGYRVVCLMDPSIVWIPGLETQITLAKQL